MNKSRRGELRQHFVGAGHPTVADGKYSAAWPCISLKCDCGEAPFLHCADSFACALPKRIVDRYHCRSDP